MLSGVSFAYKNNGAPRPATSPFPSLSFAADVHAPTAKRHLRWDSVNGLGAGDTTQVDPTDVIGYRTIVDAMAYAKDHYIPPLMADGKDTTSASCARARWPSSRRTRTTSAPSSAPARAARKTRGSPAAS